MFSCNGCIFFKEAGWALFRGKGGSIRQGPCQIRSFYTYDAARWACGGYDKQVGRTKPKPQEPSDEA